AAAGADRDRANAARWTRQQPARYGGIRVLSGRPDRYPRAPVRQRPGGRADRQPRRRLRPGRRPARACRLAGVGWSGIQRLRKMQEVFMSKAFMINRRAALGGAAALATVQAAAFPAAAQDNKRVIVGTWGGDYSRLLTKNIDTPLMVPNKWECVHAEENAPPRKAKMLAEKTLRRGTSDVQGLSSTDMFEVSGQGIVET